ncbi:uncharacterized protein METZ01_LOCUS455874, partial [marine metagenome]
MVFSAIEGFPTLPLDNAENHESGYSVLL